MKKFVFYIAITLLNVNILSSQESVRILDVTFSDEELQFRENDSMGEFILSHGFLKVDYRYLFFTIETSNLDLTDNSIHFFVRFSTTNDTIQLIYCDNLQVTDTSNILHAYCNISEQMIPGGRAFLLDDVKFGYSHLKDSLSRSMECFYIVNGVKTQHISHLPPVNIISPIVTDNISFNAPYLFRKTFCPYEHVFLFDDTINEQSIKDMTFFFEEEEIEQNDSVGDLFFPKNIYVKRDDTVYCYTMFLNDGKNADSVSLNGIYVKLSMHKWIRMFEDGKYWICTFKAKPKSDWFKQCNIHMFYAEKEVEPKSVYKYDSDGTLTEYYYCFGTICFSKKSKGEFIQTKGRLKKR